jgi:hypothetical protein
MGRQDQETRPQGPFSRARMGPHFNRRRRRDPNRARERGANCRRLGPHQLSRPQGPASGASSAAATLGPISCRHFLPRDIAPPLLSPNPKPKNMGIGYRDGKGILNLNKINLFVNLGILGPPKEMWRQLIQWGPKKPIFH